MASTRAPALDLLSLSVTLQQLQRGGRVHEIEVTEVMTRALFKGFTPYGFPFCKAKVMYRTIFFWRRQGQASQRNGTEVLWWNGKAKKRMWEIGKVGTRYRFWRLLKDCADCRKLLAILLSLKGIVTGFWTLQGKKCSRLLYMPLISP